MNSLLILVATAALGVEVGWQPLPGGGYEYTIQIEPELLKVLEQGNDEIFSEVPAGIDVRRYRVLVGTGQLRRDSAPAAASGAAAAPAASLPANQPPAAAPAARQTAPPAQPSATTDPFGTPPSEPLDPEAELDADLGKQPQSRVVPTGPAATAPPATGPPATEASPFSSPAPALHDPYEAPPAAIESPPQNAPPATSPTAVPESSGPAMPDFGNSATAQPPAKEPAAKEPAASALAAEPAALEPIPSNPWKKEQPGKAESQGRAETLIVSPSAADNKNLAKAPAKLPSAGDSAGPIQKATFDKNDASAKSQERETGKPELTEKPVSRPWFPLVAAIVLLGCSIGGNVFLGWIAYDARNRYRNAIAKFRGATA